jgi:hypothetical protein
MNLRSTLFGWAVTALLVTGSSFAATPATSDRAATLPVASFNLLWPPPPPPESCRTICSRRYQSCISAGTNPGVCAAKYNYCIIDCSNPPILTL